MRLAELQDTLEQHAREIAQLKQSRTSRQLQNREGEPFRAMDTPVENLIAATRIANSIQPSGSAAEGIQHLAFLLQKAVEQNAVVSQSLQRVHSQAPPAGTSQSVHTPYGGSRRRRDVSPQHKNDPREGYRQEQY